MKFNIPNLSTYLFLMSTGMLLFIWSSCQQGPPENSRAAQAVRGKVHFMKYCSSCHGEDGKGLKIDSMEYQPANLTILTSKKNRVFPTLEVARMIDGRKMPKSHGVRQMPVWGEVFSQEELLDETQIRGKLGELIAYLMTIQGR